MQALVVAHYPVAEHVKAGKDGDDEKGKVEYQFPVQGEEREEGRVETKFFWH
ncbi:MAG: hypothetical protein Fur0044_27010 [Anaerolineae bacterium]